MWGYTWVRRKYVGSGARHFRWLCLKGTGGPEEVEKKRKGVQKESKREFRKKGSSERREEGM
jgi:hypothetical protein